MITMRQQRATALTVNPPALEVQVLYQKVFTETVATHYKINTRAMPLSG